MTEQAADFLRPSIVLPDGAERSTSSDAQLGGTLIGAPPKEAPTSASLLLSSLAAGLTGLIAQVIVGMIINKMKS